VGCRPRDAQHRRVARPARGALARGAGDARPAGLRAGPPPRAEAGRWRGPASEGLSSADSGPPQDALLLSSRQAGPPGARKQHAAAVLGSSVYVMGGYDGARPPRPEAGPLETRGGPKSAGGARRAGRSRPADGPRAAAGHALLSTVEKLDTRLVGAQARARPRAPALAPGPPEPPCSAGQTAPVKPRRLDLTACARGQWERAPDLRVARSGLAAAEGGGRIYAVGGWDLSRDLPVRPGGPPARPPPPRPGHDGDGGGGYRDHDPNRSVAPPERSSVHASWR
jgi:hypothetical protein